MPERLDIRHSEFEARFGALIAAKREVDEDVDSAVASIIEAVRAGGDAALIALTEKFDRVRLEPQQLRLGDDEIERAAGECDKELMAALELAHARIEAHHRRQLPEDDRYTDEAGVTLGHRWGPVTSAGLYVPGGTASYPSSVLMNAVPAKVAGVGRIVMTVPAPGGELNPLVLAAARIAGVDEIYRVGGAQAIAALAYGTETIAPVAKVAGPGNPYVAAAKRRVFGVVGIDMIAGPSEVLVLADGDADPQWLAADLLAQAEHDVCAQSILITDDEGLADAVEAAVAEQLRALPRGNVAGQSWADFGAIILVERLEQAASLVDRIAPEHLEIQAADAERLMALVNNAGAIFLGRYTPEAVGDYVAGSNHVLPTARSARFSSGLSVLDFMKRSSILACTRESLDAIGPAAIALGRAEGLDAHARSVAMRLDDSDAD